MTSKNNILTTIQQQSQAIDQRSSILQTIQENTKETLAIAKIQLARSEEALALAKSTELKVIAMEKIQTEYCAKVAVQMREIIRLLEKPNLPEEQKKIARATEHAEVKRLLLCCAISSAATWYFLRG